MDEPVLQDLRATPQPIRMQVERGLRSAIVQGHFQPGDHLPDRKLCELFGASRTVVREAIRLLEAEGIVTVMPNRGAFVSLLPVGEAAQIYEVRGVLEALAGEGFALRATDQERQRLRHVFDAMCRQAGLEDNADGDTTLRLLEQKEQFYEVLLAGCRNIHVEKMLNPLLSRISQLRGLSMHTPGRTKAMLEEIGLIVDSIERRDAVAAATACRDHVRRAGTIALAALQAKSIGVP